MALRGTAIPRVLDSSPVSEGLKTIQLQQLFGCFDHVVNFPEIPPDADSPKVAILVGKNGVGKTTLLRILAGALELDFMPCRGIPLASCTITTTGGHVLAVQKTEPKGALKVSFDELSATLHPEHPGAASKGDQSNVERLRERALPILAKIAFELVDARRGERQRASDARNRSDWSLVEEEMVLDELRSFRMKGKLRRGEERTSKLADKVRRFAKDAQVDYRAFFATTSPNLIPKLVARLADKTTHVTKKATLLDRLKVIKQREEDILRLGLASVRQEVIELFELIKKTDSPTDETMAVFEWYVEVLESQHEQRHLLAARLLRFEGIVNRFLSGKKVSVDTMRGLRIETDSGEDIDESQLSSGEYQLLYMMVTALVSSRSGTVIAIDEPELSLHVQWQREIVRSLCECAAGAAPLLILATHSPTIAGEYRDCWTQLS